MSGQQQQHRRVYSRDSFDRFGDDLCQLLLSFQSFRQQLATQAVSRQWQHCLRQSMTELDLWQIYEKIGRRYDIQKLWSVVKRVIKCCPNLVAIKCSKPCNFIDTNVHYIRWPSKTYFQILVDQLVTNCPQLTAVLLDFGQDLDAFNRLIDRFGNQLTDVAVNEDCAAILCSRLLSCPKLRCIYNVYSLYGSANQFYTYNWHRPRPLFTIHVMKQLFNVNNNNNNNQHLILPKLKCLYYVYKPYDSQLFQQFVGKYGQQLTGLELVTTCGNKTMQNNFGQLCRQLQQPMIRLQSLVWHCTQWSDDQISITNTLRHLSGHLQKLRIRIGMNTAYHFRQCLRKVTTNCPVLRELTIEATYEFVDYEGINLNGGIIIGRNYMAPCPQLRSLRLEARQNSENSCHICFSRKLIANFGQKCPQLQRLYISDVDLYCVRYIFQSLVGHRHLKHVELQLSYRLSKRSYPKRYCLINTCPRLQTVRLNVFNYRYIGDELYAICGDFNIKIDDDNNLSLSS